MGKSDSDLVVELISDKLPGSHYPLINYSEARKGPLITASLSATFAGFILGCHLGWSSSAQPQLQHLTTQSYLFSNSTHFTIFPDWLINLTNQEMSWVGSLLNIGALLGSLSGGLLMDRCGRRTSLMILSVPYLIGGLLTMLAIHPSMLYVGRIISGFGGGLSCVVTPTYIGEISTPELRGRLGFLYTAMICSGLLAISLLGMVLDWRWMSAFTVASPIILLTAMFVVSESPFFLLTKGRSVDAQRALRWLRGAEYNTFPELIEMEQALEKTKVDAIRLSEFTDPEVFKPLLVAIGMMVLQEMSGINAVLFYSVDIFLLSGSNFDGLVSGMIINTVLLLGSLSSLFFLVGHIGRRALFLLSEGLAGLSILALGGYFYLKENDPDLASQAQWLPLTCLILFIATYTIGLGPLPWLMTNEIMPSRFRGLGSSVAAFTNWSMSFVVTKIFLDMKIVLTEAGTFWLFGCFCILGMLFGLFFLPETKDKTPEEVRSFFTSKTYK